MAHWTIDDHGFGGSFYTCSECGHTFCDIFSDMCDTGQCPNCDILMDEDATVYMKNGRVEE